MRRTDLIGFGPALILQDPMTSTGLQCFQVQPLPPPIPLGLIRLRGVPLSTAARPLATLFKRYIRVSC